MCRVSAHRAIAAATRCTEPAPVGPGRTAAYTPLNVPKPVAEGLWIVDGPEARMAMYGTTLPFPTRMTLVRLSGGGLWCHSPVAPEAALFAAVDALGPVRHLVAPNKLHYTHLAAWKDRYPSATVWLAPGVRERAASQGLAVPAGEALDDAPPAAWAADIDQLRFRGSRFMDEIVFLHRSSATLVVADLIENFEAERLPPLLRMLVRLAGSLHPHGRMPLDLRLTFLGHRRQARACRDRMLAWAPQRVILAHGRCHLQDGSAELRRAFAWLDG